MYSMKHPATPHKRGVSITFADLDYDDRIKTISRRKQGQVSVILGKYQLKEKVGKGAFGIVHKAFEFETGKYVAIKRLKKEYIDEKMLLQLKSEVELLKTLDHPNIVKYLGLMDSDNHINMILEFIENGSLLQTIQKCGVIPEALAAVYTEQVLQGLIYLHHKHVIHRDIKASNILITGEGIVKLADFGIATTGDMAGDQNQDNSSFVEGSPFWMSPEIIQLEPPTTAADIWSLGCTVIELVTGSPPYFELPAMSALFKIVQDSCPPISSSFSEALKDFLLKCFQRDPEKRPTATELLDHPWVRGNTNMHLDFIGAQSTIRMHNVGIGGSGEKWGNDSDSSSGGSGRGSMRGRAALSSIDWGDSSDRDSSGSDVSDGSQGRKSTLPKRVKDVAKSFEDYNHKESMSSYLVLITGSETRKNKLFSYTVFRLKVCFGKESWRVYKTYTDFKELHVLVTGWVRNQYRSTSKRGATTKPKLPKFPGAKMFGADKASFVKKRKATLQDYINGLIGISEIMKAGIVITFLRSDGKDAVSRERQSPDQTEDHENPAYRGSPTASPSTSSSMLGSASPKDSLRRSASVRNRPASISKAENRIEMPAIPEWVVDEKN